jgi:hypothetical protein
MDLCERVEFAELVDLPTRQRSALDAALLRAEPR